MTYIGKEDITVDTATSTKRQSTKAAKVVECNDPLIKLDSNKLILTTGAVDLLQICADCRVDIKYKKKDKTSVPVIGTDTAFGTKGGNKLTKTNTVSFRGAANDKLAEFGTTFTLEPSEDDGIFYLIGDKMNNPIPEDAVDIESELDIDALEALDIDAKSTDLGDFDFTL
ncbi:MAG: hypothetical protein UF228_11685 [Lachnospiraceae bacterium]|nr:hypothetical protein [Lachnospiraceae bacterium]